MTRDLIIEATGLRKTYVTGSLEVEALRGVSFAVAPGEMVAIMGPVVAGRPRCSTACPASTSSTRGMFASAERRCAT